MLKGTERISFIISSVYLRWSRSRTFTPAPTKKYPLHNTGPTVLPQIFLLPSTDPAPQIRSKTNAVILSVRQRLLSS